MPDELVEEDGALSGLNRIAIVGCPGSGKTWLARRISIRAGIPHYCLDDFYWQAGWSRPNEETWLQCIHDLVSADKWIIDGNYVASMRLRVRAAQLVIHLDLSTPVCLFAILQRLLRQIWDPASGLPKRVYENRRLIDRFYIDPKLLRMVWQFRSRTRPAMLAEFAQLDAATPIIVLRSRADVNAFISWMGKTGSV